MAKLSDANNAGGKRSKHCTLIVTEGASAKAGQSVVGRDNFTVFPLRGKLLNMHEATHDQDHEKSRQFSREFSDGRPNFMKLYKAYPLLMVISSTLAIFRTQNQHQHLAFCVYSGNGVAEHLQGDVFALIQEDRSFISPLFQCF